MTLPPTQRKPVQSHDILYKVSLDILYTPGALKRAGVMKAMAWKTMDVHEQRVRFVIEATQPGRTFGALCAAYEISRPTGYLWLQRSRELGVRGSRSAAASRTTVPAAPTAIWNGR